MNRVSTVSPALLVLLLLLGTTAYSQNQPWPLKRDIDLSSGFGDFRPNRFHAGVDLRTGGVPGAKVYSPVDGYVWRVKMSYRGYGKGLYIKGDDGHFYVLAHLSKFIDAITGPVQAEQFVNERYYVDIYFEKDQIRVKQGQLVAWSGQTGIGAPHLHFEKRSPDNVPINPLSHGFTLDDTTPPTFERIGFHKRSPWGNGRMKQYFPVRKVAPGKYVLDTLLYIDDKFGVLVDCYDQMRPGSMRQSIPRLKLIFDDLPFYESVFDSLPFEIGSEVNLRFDPVQAGNGEKRVRRLYDYPLLQGAGISHWGEARGPGAFGGKVIQRSGRHTGKIIGSDRFGNSSELTFGFVWGPGRHFFSLDTLVDREFYFKPERWANPELKRELALDSVFVEVLQGQTWRRTSLSTATFLDDNWLKVEIDSLDAVRCLRLVVSSSLGVHIPDATFGIVSSDPPPKAQLSVYPKDHGYVVMCEFSGGVRAPVWIPENPDELSDSLKEVFFDRYSRVPFDSRVVIRSPFGWTRRTMSCLGRMDGRVIDLTTSSVFVTQIHPGDGIPVEVDDVFEIAPMEEGFYSNEGHGIAVSVEQVDAPANIKPFLNSPVYSILPEGFVVKKPLEFSIKLPPSKASNKHTGLCWFDKEENEWVWIDEETENEDRLPG
jgi:hypothetical protein